MIMWMHRKHWVTLVITGIRAATIRATEFLCTSTSSQAESQCVHAACGTVTSYIKMFYLDSLNNAPCQGVDVEIDDKLVVRQPSSAETQSQAKSGDAGASTRARTSTKRSLKGKRVVKRGHGNINIDEAVSTEAHARKVAWMMKCILFITLPPTLRKAVMQILRNPQLTQIMPTVVSMSHVYIHSYAPWIHVIQTKCRFMYLQSRNNRTGWIVDCIVSRT
jgi:hypothetical protein